MERMEGGGEVGGVEGGRKGEGGLGKQREVGRGEESRGIWRAVEGGGGKWKPSNRQNLLPLEVAILKTDRLSSLYKGPNLMLPGVWQSLKSNC